MTECYICGRGMDSISIDIRDNKTKPCSTCENVIQENLAMISKKGKTKGHKETDPDVVTVYDNVAGTMFAVIPEEFDEADYSDVLNYQSTDGELDDYFE